MDVVGRFWSRVDKNGPVSPVDNTSCWLRTTSLDSHGYAQFYCEGRKILAHRFSYELINGPIPDGPDGRTLRLDHRHTCPKNCVRPEHLRPATAKQNAENRAGATRESKSGVRGVFPNTGKNKGKKNGWQAIVGHNGKKHYLGVFSSIEEAEAAVVAKRAELFTHNDSDRL